MSRAPDEGILKEAGAEVRSSVNWRGGLLLILVSAAAMTVSARYHLFLRLGDFARSHRELPTEQMFSVLIVSAVLGFVLVVRRSRALSRELRLRREAEDRIRVMALHDPLTGLANRRKMHEALVQAVASRRGAALLMLDLDRFKPINDLHGHGVGDKVLKAVADRLIEVVRDGELVARMGGDEFAVLLTDIDSPEVAARPARRILQALEQPFQIDQLECQIGGTIGVASTCNEKLDPETLVHRADVALYRAKREGRGQFRFFEEEMDRQVRTRARLELEFRHAVAQGQVAPYYQPLVELATGQVRGFEVLARWLHPTDGMIMPDVFIPIAEDTGLIGEMTLSLLRQACIDAQGWPADTMLSLNISPVQLRDKLLPDRLQGVLAAHGFSPNRLEVEITENALVSDFAAAKEILSVLKSHGVQIALDDFGTGYSTLHHLRELPFDKLKIDRSFILSLDENEDSRKIVDAIISLGHSLGLTTIAEGVEDLQSAERLAELGCEMAQGYWFGVPKPEAYGALGAASVAPPTAATLAFAETRRARSSAR